jgi:serine/threonine-protein kinase
MSYQLRVIEGPDRGKTFELPTSGTVRVGRAADTATQLTDRTVSRYHCQLEVEGDRVLVTSSSQSGTLVNDQLITQQELHEEDVIRLGTAGETRIVFEVVDIHAGATLRGGAEKLQEAMASELKGLLGKSLAHFRINQALAEGGNRSVFLARDTQHGRDVALKVIAPGPQELRTLGQTFPLLRPVLGIEHPNLVPLYEADQTGIHYWISMEVVEGESLQKHLEQAGLSGVIDWPHVLRIGIQLARGLEALHQRAIVHGSITPARVLVTRGTRQAKLGGLWRARLTKDCRAGSGDVQEVLKQLAYVPPERLRGARPASSAGDVYSLGAVLYHLLAGRAPFHAGNDADLINLIIQTEAAPLKEVQFSIPDRFEQVVKRMLAKAPEARYADASEVLSALQEVAAPGAAASPPEPVGPPPRREEPGRKITQEMPAPAPRSAPAANVAPAAVAAAPAVAPAAAEGRLSVTCKCGQTLQARKQFAGTRVRCPCCGDFIDLPGRPQSSQSSQVVTLPHTPLPRPSVTRPTAEAGPKATTPLARKIVRAIAVLVLVIGTVLVFYSGMAFNFNSPAQKAEKTNPATKASSTANPATPPSKP